MNPRLSICVPSRNRQRYFQQTVLALISSPRRDVEFVFADNSDDPSIMQSFFDRLAEDRRIRFLPTGPKIYSMVENWERTVAATTGEWITVIGDDDYVDPELATVLQKLELLAPGIEAFSWGYATFTWPTEGLHNRTNNKVPLAPQFIELSREWLFNRAFRWEEATIAPVHGFSVYHGALSRPLMERIRARFNGRYFEHPTVDFDSSFKAVLEGKRFIHWQRPLSIFGACPASTSVNVLKPREFERINAAFMAEVGRDINDDPSMDDLPFHCNMGVPASVLVTQQWLKSAIGLTVDGWQDNFAIACANYCSKIRDRADFDMLSDAYRRAFEAWNGGRHAGAFKPVYSGAEEEYQAYSGLRDGKVYINDGLSAAATPRDIYDIIGAVLPPIEDTDINPAAIRRLPTGKTARPAVA